MNLRERLEEQRDALEALAGEHYLTARLKDYFHAQLIFVSTNIEDIKISLEESEDIVAQYPDFHPIAADNTVLLQAKGQKIALEYVEKLAGGDEPITADTVRTIHRMVFDQAVPEMAGRYRDEQTKIRGTQFMPTIHYFIPAEMLELDDRLRQDMPSADAPVWDILEFATWAHYEAVKIHPFKDGNGRVARILFNLLCRRYGLPYVLVPKSGTEDRLWDGLHAANQDDLSKLVQYYGELLAESYDFVISEYEKKS